MAAQTRRVLVPRLDDRFEEPVIDVATLEGFQKLEYDTILHTVNATYNQHYFLTTYLSNSAPLVCLVR